LRLPAGNGEGRLLIQAAPGREDMERNRNTRLRRMEWEEELRDIYGGMERDQQRKFYKERILSKI
jgi:hypothetical protein